MSPTEINANLLSKRKLPCVIIGRESPEMWKIFYEARYSIFVDGLKQPYNDVFDENDPNCVHVGLQLIENDGSGEWMVGTCRLRLIPPFIKLERMGVREVSIYFLQY
ncbi:hypothetical protein AB6A40_009462 [Gnathostoma spinigerum]|uniref:Uncharacterized protein n=1 Tax=Gnathostoma spinigerum TaxID=75299 RepID=A0ABD6EZY3_9BILA